VGFAFFIVSNDDFANTKSLLFGNIPSKSSMKSKKCVLKARSSEDLSVIMLIK
jgi:hypothetical protein